jgi:hypothetical protein
MNEVDKEKLKEHIKKLAYTSDLNDILPLYKLSNNYINYKKQIDLTNIFNTEDSLIEFLIKVYLQTVYDMSDIIFYSPLIDFNTFCDETEEYKISPYEECSIHDGNISEIVSEIFEGDFEKFLEDYTYEVNQLIENEYPNNIRYIIGLIYLNPDSPFGHANSFIFDRIKKVFYRFEPHGAYRKCIDYIYREFFKLKGIDYVVVNTDPQERDNENFEEFETYEYGGYCLVWSILFLHLFVHYRNINKIIRILESLNTPYNIRLYTEFITNLKLQFLNKQNSLSSLREKKSIINFGKRSIKIKKKYF